MSRSVAPDTIAGLEDVRILLRQLPPAAAASAAAARARQAELTKPPGSLGRLEDLAVWLAAWQGRANPVLERVRVFVFAGNHGVTARGVSAFPPEVTVQMVANFRAGGAAINQLAECFGAGLEVVPLELERPTADFTTAPAMTEEECAAALRTGYSSLEEPLDLLALGEMGIGNTTAAAAVTAALLGGPAARFVGPGTGLDGEGVRRKAAVVEEGLRRHRDALSDPLEVLRRLGGREIAAMTGLLLAARRRRVPVLLDGYVCCAAAAVLHALEPDALAHCQAGHRSAEPAHRLLLEHLGLTPLLDLGMRLGEASGAAVAIGILRAAVACHNGMATFASAGVSGGEGTTTNGEESS